jgi:hypothetical protein
MRKIITIVLVVLLIAAMTVPAFAANIVPIGKTIIFKMPTIKTVDVSYSTVYESAKVAIIKNLSKIPLN